MIQWYNNLFFSQVVQQLWRFQSRWSRSYWDAVDELFQETGRRDRGRDVTSLSAQKDIIFTSVETSHCRLSTAPVNELWVLSVAEAASFKNNTHRCSICHDCMIAVFHILWCHQQSHFGLQSSPSEADRTARSEWGLPGAEMPFLAWWIGLFRRSRSSQGLQFAQTVSHWGDLVCHPCTFTGPDILGFSLQEGVARHHPHEAFKGVV